MTRLEFPDGHIVLLTDLSEGQTASVLQLPAQPATPAEARAQERVPRTSADRALWEGWRPPSPRAAFLLVSRRRPYWRFRLSGRKMPRSLAPVHPENHIRT